MTWEIIEISFKISFGISYFVHLLEFFYYNDIASQITQRYVKYVTEYNFYENILVVLLAASLLVMAINIAFPFVLLIQSFRYLGKINTENIDKKYVEKLDFFDQFFTSISLNTLLFFPLVYFIVGKLQHVPEPEPKDVTFSEYVPCSVTIPRGKLEVLSQYGRADHCVICCDANIGVKFLPCKHQTLCRTCYNLLDSIHKLKCITCRKEIKAILFFSPEWLTLKYREKIE